MPLSGAADHETPAGRTLSSTSTAGPVGASLSLKPLRTLVFKVEHHLRPGSKLPGKSLQRPQGQIGGLGHEQANLLGRVEHINPIGSQIIGASRERTKASEVPLGQFNFGLSLM